MLAYARTRSTRTTTLGGRDRHPHLIDEETEIPRLTHCHPTENLTQHPHYHTVILGTLPLPSPASCPQTALAPFFLSRLAGGSAAGHHATRHARQLLCAGAAASEESVAEGGGTEQPF